MPESAEKNSAGIFWSASSFQLENSVRDSSSYISAANSFGHLSPNKFEVNFKSNKYAVLESNKIIDATNKSQNIVNIEAIDNKSMLKNILFEKDVLAASAKK